MEIPGNPNLEFVVILYTVPFWGDMYHFQGTRFPNNFTVNQMIGGSDWQSQLHTLTLLTNAQGIACQDCSLQTAIGQNNNKKALKNPKDPD